MRTHNICLYKKVNKMYTGCNLKTMEFHECALIRVCAVIRSNTVCLFVLRFYGPVNPMGSCQARSVYLTTRLLGRLNPLSG